MVIVLLLLLVVYVVVYFFFGYNETVKVKSDTDGNVYKIRQGRQKDTKYLKDSSNILGEINLRIETLIKHLLSKYGNDPEYLSCVHNLRKRYKHSVLSEAAVDQRYTTFTVDKRDMHVCLRTRDNQSHLYDINILMYVILHELAHMCNYDANGVPIHGHGREFVKIFRFLVRESINIGVYTYVDFSNQPQEYCGMYINSSVV
ncbi:hypothetical protein EB118_03450 [bacterium]|nr:hypothetical protein [bacterium]NDC94034.1 hypothetical protein [bacterium]NDD82720.1 hypothetical protein [bacterium]NDG29141.1 hypothetical protein [bacterium]